MQRSTFHSYLYAAFFLSGASGLIYQTVWVRMLTRVLGSTTPAVATVLCVFMGGLALGSYWGGKFADRRARLLAAYGGLEVAIPILALLASFAVISLLGRLYVSLHPSLAGSPWALLTAQILLAIVSLLPPTILMGATLPILVASMTRLGEHFQTGVGRLYAINTFGAVVGVFATGFVLLGELGERASLCIAALLNALAALIALVLAKRLEGGGSTPAGVEPTPVAVAMPYAPRVRTIARIALFVSGFTALAYEILWTRLLVLPLETSIYAFSFMLGMFLLGIAIGSWISTRVASAGRRPLVTFALIEILIGIATVGGMAIFPSFEFIAWTETAGQFIARPLVSFVLVFPLAVLFGWQFPAAVRCCMGDSRTPGTDTGLAYSINTVGAIAGSLLAGFALLPWLGLANTMIALAAVNVVFGLALLAVTPPAERGRLTIAAAGLAVLFLAVAFTVGDPYLSVVRERLAKMWDRSDLEIYSYDEGVSGTTVAAGAPDRPRVRSLLINGVGMTSLVTETKLMAHLPLALVDDPHRFLVLCFGMGTAVRSASRYPALQIDAVDIVPHVFACFPYYHADARTIAAMPNVRLVYGDGRNFLLVNEKRYDGITIDPAPPIHSAGTVNLYSREFLELCKRNITPGGVVCLWLPPAPKSELLMIMRTFVNVFPGASLWGSPGYPGFFLTGGHRSFEQTEDSIASFAKRLAAIPDLTEWESLYGSEEALKRLFLLNPKELEELVSGVQEVTDDKPYTEFPMWRRLFREDGRGEFSANLVHEALEESRGQGPIAR